MRERTNPLRLLLPLLGMLLLPAVAMGQAAPAPDILLRYAAYWGGLHAADVTLALRQDDERYDVVMEVAGRGLIGWLVDLSTAGHSRGSLLAETTPRPLLYRYYQRDGDDESVVEIEFDPATGRGHSQERTRDAALRGRPDGWEVEPQDGVPATLRTGVFDPLSLVPLLRDALPRALEDGRRSLAIPVFDGKRRFDVAVRLKGEGRHELAGRDVETLDIEATIEPVAGFSRRKAESWRGTTATIRLDRRHLMPLRIQLDGTVATVIRAVDVCVAANGCAFTLAPEARTALDGRAEFR